MGDLKHISLNGEIFALQGSGGGGSDIFDIVTEQESGSAKVWMTTEEIVQAVISALGTPVFGRVDNDRNIILSGALTAGTYTVKYENEDGSTTTIGTVSVGA